MSKYKHELSFLEDLYKYWEQAYSIPSRLPGIFKRRYNSRSQKREKRNIVKCNATTKSVITSLTVAEKYSLKKIEKS